VNPSRRRPALLAVAAITVLAGAAYGAHWYLTGRHVESTDNAYVQAPVVQVTPQVGGTVLAVLVDDTDIVKAGQPLVKLDPADARLALERAEAQLAQTVREVRTLYANNASLDSNIRLREAEVDRLRADMARAAEDVARRRPLVATGAVGGEEMKHAESTLAAARSAVAGAQSALAAARQQAASNQALTEGTSVEKHPNVERAAAAVREAWLALQRVELVAPVSGQVARRTVQVGQRIAAGAPLMSLIPLDQVWVEANFKEVQLRQMRIGQPVKLTADLYGQKVEYDGRVVGLGAGTGAAFALLPAQNATGNWIKVVQRVPVRVELDARQLAAHPLRVGLSMEATVDVARQEGQPVAAAAPRVRGSAGAPAIEAQPAGADHLVQQIIQANLGRPGDAARLRADRVARTPGAKPAEAQAGRPSPRAALADAAADVAADAGADARPAPSRLAAAPAPAVR
jgi:membrane fusion protein (multidrug efflux system)